MYILTFYCQLWVNFSREFQFRKNNKHYITQRIHIQNLISFNVMWFCLDSRCFFVEKVNNFEDMDDIRFCPNLICMKFTLYNLSLNKKLPPENIFNIRIARIFQWLPPLGSYFFKSRRKLFPVVAALCRKVQKFKKICRNFRRRKPLYRPV